MFARFSRATATSRAIIRLGLSSVESGPCRPHGAFSRADLSRLSSSVEGRNIFRPVVIHRSGISKCRVVTKRHHCHTSGVTGEAAVPTVIHSLGRRRVVRVTILRGLRERSLAPLRRTRTCGALVRGLGLARTRISRHLKGSHPCVTGCLHLLDLPGTIGSFLRGNDLSVKRTEALLSMGSGGGLITLTRGAIGRNLAIHRLRDVIGRVGNRGSGRGGIEGPTGLSPCLGRDRRLLHRGFDAGITVGDDRGANGNGVRVSCLSGSSLGHVLRVLSVALS